MGKIQHLAMLREMGLGPLWRLRCRPVDEASTQLIQSENAEAAQGTAAPASVQNTSPDAHFAAKIVAGEPVNQLANTSYPVHEFATASDLHSVADVAAVTVQSLEKRANNDRAARIAALPWDALATHIGTCAECVLCQQRIQSVPGEGDPSADWLFVGEGPGAEEDRQGRPFVGAAGKLLDAMLFALGLSRSEQVFIANAVKCRPPFNRTPASQELAACAPYLHRQIELIKPKVIVALGRPAAQTLLQKEVKINAVRQKQLRYYDTPLVVTYHPAYLLRNPADKAKAWQDLCFARDILSA